VLILGYGGMIRQGAGGGREWGSGPSVEATGGSRRLVRRDK
jgi:hypothetical protein